MAKSSLTRRQFLRVSAMGTTAAALSSCASLDRYFMGDTGNLQNEVVILGAGAAGLAAAYELKKRKIPFRVFEASSRVGGRVQSVNVSANNNLIAELGAEFFAQEHLQVHRFAKELNLSTQEVVASAGFEPHFFRFADKNYRVKDILPLLRQLQKPFQRVRSDLYRDQKVALTYKEALSFERSKYYDSLSLKDLLASWENEVDPTVLKLIEVQAVARFGVDASEQSSLHFLETLDEQGSSLLRTGSQFRLDGGLTKLMQALGSRVVGVLPDHFVKMNHALVEISEKGQIFELTFSTPTGVKRFSAKNVICTIPFSKLKNVKGLERMQFSSAKMENILSQNYASHSKGAVVFPNPFWRQKKGKMSANLGNFTGDFVAQKLWDSGRSQATDQGLMTFQCGGSSGRSANADFGNVIFKDLNHFYEVLPTGGSLVALTNWTQKKWAEGSMAYFKPGQFMKFKGVAREPEYSGHFLFAGEHTSIEFPGTLQGALESGVEAASEIEFVLT